MEYFAWDVESYHDNAGVGVKRIGADDDYRMFTTCPEVVGGEPLSAFAKWFGEHENSAVFLSINGMNYDLPMMRAVLDGKHDPAELKALSDKLISEDDFLHRRKRLRNEFSCDLLAMHGGMELVAGSKEMAVKGNLQSIRESPVSFDAPSTTDEDKLGIWHTYNVMDLQTIDWCFSVSRREFDLRWRLLESDKVDVLNEADSGVADLLMRAKLYPEGGVSYPIQTIFDLKLAPIAAKFPDLHDPEAIALRDRIAQVEMEFKVEAYEEHGQAKKRLVGPTLRETLVIGGVTFRIGKGGLHSEDGPAFFVADDTHRILNCDFSSFYPNLILIHGLCPKHVARDAFLNALRTQVDRRLHAKASGDDVLADALKVAVNSIFGKAGSPYAPWFDPTALISCTMLGQLSLIQLVDLLVSGTDPDQLQIVSANTDGVTFRVNSDIADSVIEAVNALATHLGHPKMGWAEYSRLVRRDVNNYVAFGMDGKIKTAKGAYQYRTDRVRGKAVNQISIDAAQQWFADETPIAETVRKCSDVRKFIDYRKTPRAYVIADDRGHTHGTIQRWVIVTGPKGVHLDTLRVADGARTQVVSHGALLMPDLLYALPPDIDYDHYIAIAQGLVDDILNPQVKVSHVIPLGELSKVQREKFFANSQIMDASPRVMALDLEPWATDYAAVCKGNPRDSMKHCLLRLWWAQEGLLTQGDLLWAAKAIDAPVAYFQGRRARNLEQMVEWIATDISPFPKPRSTAECVRLALTWAIENVERSTGQKVRMRHTSAVVGSKYLTADILRHFARDGNEYRLACKVAARSVKYEDHPSAEMIERVLEDVKAYVAGNGDELRQERTPLQAMRDQDRWDYFSTPYSKRG